MPGDQTPRRPTGRTFAEFLDGLGHLSPAEQELLDACTKGRSASIGAARPNGVTGKNRIRSGFLRFLLLAGDDRAAVHEKGVHLIGAWIDGDIDLEDCHARVALWLTHCYVEGTIILRDSEIPWVTIENSFTKGIDGERLRCRGNLHLKEGTEVQGSVALDGARIGGDFECNGCKIGKDDGISLSCDDIEIQGNAYLGYEGKQGQFHAAGDVHFSGARIRGECDCTGAKFEGSAWFIDAHIGSDMDFSGSQFFGNHEIILSAAEIGGRFFFRDVKGRLGSIWLRAAYARALIDDEESWMIANDLILDGFRYDRFLDAEVEKASQQWIGHYSPTDASTRIRWLDRQRREDMVTNLKPQPWEQLIKVLRESGHAESAREVAIAKQQRLRQAGKIKGLAGALHDAFGELSGYGYRPIWFLRWFFVVWLFCSVFYVIAAGVGVMAPTNPRVFDEAKYAQCRPEAFGNWTTCEKAPYEYTTFNPFLYSLALILPLIELQQEKDWAPMMLQPCVKSLDLVIAPVCVRSAAEAKAAGEDVTMMKPAYWPFGVFIWTLTWAEVLFGWIAGLLFVAVISGLVQRD